MIRIHIYRHEKCISIPLPPFTTLSCCSYLSCSRHRLLGIDEQILPDGSTERSTTQKEIRHKGGADGGSPAWWWCSLAGLDSESRDWRDMENETSIELQHSWYTGSRYESIVFKIHQTVDYNRKCNICSSVAPHVESQLGNARGITGFSDSICMHHHRSPITLVIQTSKVLPTIQAQPDQ